MGGPYPSYGAPNPPTPDKWWYKYASFAAYGLIYGIIVFLIARGLFALAGLIWVSRPDAPEMLTYDNLESAEIVKYTIPPGTWRGVVVSKDGKVNMVLTKEK